MYSGARRVAVQADGDYMEIDLLATKLLIPPPTRRTIARNELCDALELGVPASRLILVSAPAGYGKTTLLSQWARASHIPVAWLTLNEADNDLERFFRYLLHAWETVLPGIRKSPLGLILGGVSPDSEAVLATFINVANAMPDHMAFVLDDAHLIEDPAIHVALNFLLDHLPPTLHFVLACRDVPPLSLARYRARHELMEFGVGELAFDLDQTKAFLNDTMELDLENDIVASLHGQVEGWITGLQLVALTSRQHHEPGKPFVVSGRHRHVADYLSEDVLAHLSQETRTFLLQTSILGRLCHPLCEAVTGNRQSQHMLESLERANLFLAPLDDDRTWFRYHPIFAGFLEQRLHQDRPDAVADLHSRAARWCLAHDLPETAFRHALEGNDVETVIQIFERYLHPKMFGGEIRVVARWIDSLPPTWLANHPELLIAQASYLLTTGQPDACDRRLGDLERLAGTAGNGALGQSVARATAIRCFMACFSNDLARAEAYAQQAFRELPAEDFDFRANIYHALGETYRGNGRWHEAGANYLSVLGLVQERLHEPSSRLLAVHVYGALADLELRQGRANKAAEHWVRAQAFIEDRQHWGHVPLPVTGWIYLRMGELFYERNDLERAWAYVPGGLERAELGGDTRAIIAGSVILARLELTSGAFEAAETRVERARLLLDKAQFPDWVGHFNRCRVELWLAQNKLRTAVAWSDEMLKDAASGHPPASEWTRLAIARVLIHKGDPDALTQAERFIHRLILAAEAQGQSGAAIEALGMRSLIHEHRGDRTSMLMDLERALRVAEPEGYVRLFVDLGLPMARLLQEAHGRGVMRDYVTHLLAAFDGDATASGSPLAEPLSSREREVLRLIAAGLSNREVAESLFVSPETIKKHTGNIYGKLGVRGRIEAVTKARTLAIID